MSIASELIKLETNRNDIVSAINEKGVTLASDSGLSLCPAAIKKISSGYDTSDATATSSEILSGETAYGTTGKITGTLTVVTCYHGSSEPESTLGDVDDLYIMINETDEDSSSEDTESNYVGTIDDSEGITLNDSLPSDTYTLKYEDESNTPLEGWSDIATITKS